MYHVLTCASFSKVDVCHDTNISLFYRLSRRIFWIGIANFVLSPFILLWVILYSFFTYAEVGLPHLYMFSCMLLLFLYY